MQLSELLYQKIQGLGAQGVLALRPGYVVVVSPSPALRYAVVAALFPGPDDEKYLTDGTGGPTRVGLGVVPPNGVPMRLLRELGGDRQLQRIDPATKKFNTITKDSLEIESYVRLECGLPAHEVFAGFFVFDVAELPSVRGKPQAVVATPADQKRAAALKAELENTQKYEEMQDRLFKVSDRLLQLEELLGKVDVVKGELAAVDQQRGKVAYTPEQTRDILARASRLKEAEKQRDEELGKVNMQRRKLRDYAPPKPEPFHKSTLFSGGIAAGVLIDAVAIAMRRPSIALLGLIGFGAALVAVLQWISGDEADELQARHFEDLKDREDRIKREFLEQMGPVRNAMRAADLDSVVDLVALFKEREALDKKRAPVQEKLAALMKDERLAGAEEERKKLAAEKIELENAVHSQGFARPISQIEGELKEALGLGGGAKAKAAVADAEVPKSLFAQAAQVLAVSPDSLAGPLEPRLAAYLGALTDKRVASGRMDPNGQLLLSTPDGRWGPYAGLPQPLRDQAFLALRLALLERVAQAKKIPILVDDALASLDPAKKALVARMLKGIAAHTQVIHRSAEAPPPNVADAVVQLS